MESDKEKEQAVVVEEEEAGTDGQQEEVQGVTFIEPDSNTKMTAAKKKRVEKARQKVALKVRRQELFRELSKMMLTSEELPNFRSSTMLGVDMDAENKENIVIMPKKAVPKQPKQKKTPVKEEPEKVTQIVVADGKKTFGFGFVNDNVKVVEKEQEVVQPKMDVERVIFINTPKEEEEDSSVSDQGESMEEISEGEESTDEGSQNQSVQETKDPFRGTRETSRVRSVTTRLEELPRPSADVPSSVATKKDDLVKKDKRIVPVEIPRSEEMKERRSKLPVMMEEANIIEAVIENEVVVVCGETGSGKTTQIPQILYEIGFGNPNSVFKGMIGVTQPRRIAATAMAERVKEEMGGAGNVVSHQIRYDSTVSPDTKIKFMTDGILLRESQSDVLLQQYSCIIIDEAHERSINTDVLIGLLSRIVGLRNKRNLPLRLIIMSATLRISEFLDNERLFKVKPALIQVGSRQYPVRSYFSKRTEVDDYCSEAIDRVNKIHRKLPPGGILVFLTGHREIEDVCSRLREMKGNEDLHVLPLYSSLDPENQHRVFDPVPEGKRLCVVSTNVAETSLTIPNIKYVVDSGRAKERVYDSQSGVSAFVIDWISKASAEQRAGRAGRTGEGFCYRLYSSAVYNDTFVDFYEPEVKRMPLESVVLSLKGIGIDRVINFPFPSALSVEGLRRATSLLQVLGLLDEKENVTEMGKIVKEFPLHPRLGKLLYLAQQAGLQEIGLSLVSSLSVGELFTDVKCDRSVFMNKDSDLLSYVQFVSRMTV